MPTRDRSCCQVKMSNVELNFKEGSYFDLIDEGDYWYIYPKTINPCNKDGPRDKAIATLVRVPFGRFEFFSGNLLEDDDITLTIVSVDYDDRCKMICWQEDTSDKRSMQGTWGAEEMG